MNNPQKQNSGQLKNAGLARININKTNVINEILQVYQSSCLPILTIKTRDMFNVILPV